MTDPTLHDDLARAEPDYAAIAKQADGLGEIRARLDKAQSEGSKTLVRAIFLCGVFGRTFPEQAKEAGGLLMPHLDNPDRQVRVGVGAAAVEIGRTEEGSAVRDEVLTRLLTTPGSTLPNDPDVVRGWVLNAIGDNKIPLENSLRDAVEAVASGHAVPTPGPVLQERARQLLSPPQPSAQKSG